MRRYTRRFNRKPSLTKKAAGELKAALEFAEMVLDCRDVGDMGRDRIRAIQNGIDWGVALAEWKMKEKVIGTNKD